MQAPPSGPPSKPATKEKTPSKVPPPKVEPKVATPTARIGKAALPKEGPPRRPDASPDAKEVNRLWKEAEQVKKKHDVVLKHATMFKSRVECGAVDYGWAVNSPIFAALKDGIDELRGQVTDFGSEFLLHSTKIIKQRYPEYCWRSELTAFNSLQDVIQTLETTHSVLQEQHTQALRLKSLGR
jgi:hypothetical protein